MSPPFSSRELNRSAGGRAALDRDVPCMQCGYNLRGLRRGNACPECGTRQNIDTAPADMLTRGDSARRWRWRAGLVLGAICLLVVILARWGLFVGGAAGASDVLAHAYLTTGLIVAVGWNLATWLVTPASVIPISPQMSMIRWVIRGTQALWIVGMALWFLRYQGTAGAPFAIASMQALQAGQLLCRLIAGIGALLLAWMLMRLAADAWIEDAERRLNAAIWGLPILAILPQAFPATLEWIFLVPLGLLLVGWSWFMWLYARGILQMHAHVRWSMIHRREGFARAARTEETRQELQQAASQQVRAIPRHADDDDPIPLA